MRKQTMDAIVAQNFCEVFFSFSLFLFFSFLLMLVGEKKKKKN